MSPRSTTTRHLRRRGQRGERYNGLYTDDLKQAVDMMMNKRVAVLSAGRIRSWDHNKLGLARRCRWPGQPPRAADTQAAAAVRPRHDLLELGGQLQQDRSSGAMSCTPIGSPSADIPSGSEIAAQPVTLAIGVHPVWANSTSKNARVVPRG